MKIYVSIIQNYIVIYFFGKEAHISFGKKVEKNLRQRISKDNRVYVMRVYKEAS